MIERIGESLEFRAHYTASKVGVTGLTVTVDLWGPAHTEIVTGGSATEMGDGLYYYVLSSGSVTAAGLYTIIFKTATSTVDQQHLPANFTIGTDWVENLDATISSRASQTSVDTIDDLLDTEVAAIKADTAAILDDTGTDGVVVAAASKTGYALSAAGVQAIWDALTSGLVTAGSIGKYIVDLPGTFWAYATRTLTANVNGVTIVSAVSGNAITVYEYATWAFTLTDSALALTDYENLIFAVKRSASDVDNDALLIVDITTGLVRIGGAAPTATSLGSVTKDSATSFTVLVAMSEVTTRIAGNYGGVFSWQLKGIDTDDNPDQGFVLITGKFAIVDGNARAIL